MTGEHLLFIAVVAIDLIAAAAVIRRFGRGAEGARWVRPSATVIAITFILAVFLPLFVALAAAVMNAGLFDETVEPIQKARKLAESISFTMSVFALLSLILFPPSIAVLWKVYRR